MTQNNITIDTLVKNPRRVSKSDGSIIPRLYERFSRASRRRVEKYGRHTGSAEEAYMRGVYDAYKTLADELYKMAETPGK